MASQERERQETYEPGGGPGVPELWKGLKVGDRVRFVRMPSGVDAPGYTFARETRRLYEQLIARSRPARVCRVDGDGLPWIQCRFRRRNGRWQYHWLAINDDSWVRVRERTAGPPQAR